MDDYDIHNARQHIKKARAALRLLRCALPGSQFRAEDALLRRAASPLGRVRDGRIMVQKLDGLVAGWRGAGSLRGVTKLKMRLNQDLERERARVMYDRKGLKRTRRSLHEARRVAHHLRVHKHERLKLTRGIRRVYSEGRGALEDSKKHPDAAHLHVLRKKSKYLAHQLKMMASTHSSTLGRVAADFRKLSDTLGNDHDLAVLSDRVSSCLGIFPDGESQTRLLAAIDQRRTALKRKALLRAERLFRDKRPHFAKRRRPAGGA